MEISEEVNEAYTQAIWWKERGTETHAGAVGVILADALRDTLARALYAEYNLGMQDVYEPRWEEADMFIHAAYIAEADRQLKGEVP